MPRPASAPPPPAKKRRLSKTMKKRIARIGGILKRYDAANARAVVVPVKHPRRRPRSRALKPLVAATLRSLPRDTTPDERERIASFCEVAVEACSVFGHKHLDYGDDVAEDGALGLAIMLRKKSGRLINTAGKPTANEAKKDSAMDHGIYGLMLLMFLTGRWPGITKNPRLSL